MSDTTFRPTFSGKDIVTWSLKALAMLGSLTAVVVTVVWLAGHRDADIGNHESRLAKLEAVSSEQAKTLMSIQEMTARIDERVLLLLRSSGPVTAGHVRP